MKLRLLMVPVIVFAILILPVPWLSAADEPVSGETPEMKAGTPPGPPTTEDVVIDAGGQDRPSSPASAEEEVQIPAPQEVGTPPATPTLQTGLRVEKTVIAVEIHNRDPFGVATVFPGGAGHLYCHSLVLGAGEATEIHHVWFWGEQKMADVPLAVRPGRYRTYSSKRLLPQWTGEWRVEVRGPAGELLSTAAFNVE